MQLDNICDCSGKPRPGQADDPRWPGPVWPRPLLGLQPIDKAASDASLTFELVNCSARGATTRQSFFDWLQINTLSSIIHTIRRSGFIAASAVCRRLINYTRHLIHRCCRCLYVRLSVCLNFIRQGRRDKQKKEKKTSKENYRNAEFNIAYICWEISKLTNKLTRRVG